MAQESSAPDWSTRLALSIAAEVRRHRQAQGLSAQQLSDRCAAIGMPIQRSVLANLESGRRTTVTVAEVLVLAHALGVPPGVLMFPVGHESQSESLPGGYMEPYAAVEWISGRVFIDQDVSDEFFETPLGLVRLHQDAVRQLQQRMRKRSEAARRMVSLELEYSDAAALEGQAEAELDLADEELRRISVPGLINGDEHHRIARRRHELSEQLSDARRRAESLRDQLRYARTWADSTEEEVHLSDAAVRKYRDEIASRGLVLPLLPRELSYLAPNAGFLEDRVAKPKAFDLRVKSSEQSPMSIREEEVDWGQVMRERDARVEAEGASEAGESQNSEPQEDVSFTQSREAYTASAAEEIAEALARVLERKGMRLVHESEDGEGEGA
ncbi:helix-turn-helix domain-containing protein [Streptomyces laculatispora]|uniref:helix-turn-helix domain-containing protein n=1 Tax=Streptomyces laculatispora TaxID=887464 RepID=UPI001A93DA13|nr:helix-turn-helix domain-containing protein [Streptomyces laculatispora]MBO0917504.1 helix-turn-helix domain-containing protein [Streptomyces laculatispora]